MNRIATALLLPATLSISRANPPDKACSLLTDAEITATVGAPSKSQDDQMAVTQGPAKGETMKLCTWTVPTGTVNVAFGKVADLEAGRSAFRAQMQQTIDLLKEAGVDDRGEIVRQRRHLLDRNAAQGRREHSPGDGVRRRDERVRHFGGHERVREDRNRLREEAAGRRDATTRKEGLATACAQECYTEIPCTASRPTSDRPTARPSWRRDCACSSPSCRTTPST